MLAVLRVIGNNKNQEKILINFCKLHLTAIAVESRHACSLVPQASAANVNIEAGEGGMRVVCMCIPFRSCIVMQIAGRNHLLRTIFSYQLL